MEGVTVNNWDCRTMGDLQFQELHFLRDDQAFSSIFFAPYDPYCMINLKPDTENGEISFNNEADADNNYTFWSVDQGPSLPENMQGELNLGVSERYDTSLILPNQTKPSNPISDPLVLEFISKGSENQVLHNDLFPFNPWVLEMINFEIPTNPAQLIDTTAYVNKAVTEYGEDFAKKVEENLTILLEAMNHRSCCCEG